MDTLFQWLLDRLKELALWFFQYVSQLGATVIANLLAALSLIVPASALEGLGNYLAGINYFFPLTETVGYAVGLFNLWVLCAVYRLVKSWIPTVSGS